MGARILRQVNGVFDSETGELLAFLDENGRESPLAVEQSQIQLTGSTYWLTGAGVPVDYTDGDPAATGEGVAGIGSLYSDTTNGDLYINAGTQAEPVWKLVTRAA